MALGVHHRFRDGCEDHMAEVNKCRATLLQQKGVLLAKRKFNDHCLYYYNPWVHCMNTK